MAQPIKICSIFKASRSIYNKEKRRFLLFILSAVTFDLLATLATQLPDEYIPLQLLISFSLGLFAYPWVYQQTMHCSLSILRGRKEVLGKAWKFLLGWIALAAISNIIGLSISVFPTTIWTTLVNKHNPIIVGALIKFPISFFLLVRLGFILPAIAVDDPYDYSLAWRMGKNHSFRLVISALPFIFVSVTALVLMELIETNKSAMSVYSWIMAISIITGTTSILSIIGYSTWYEKLRIRYETIQPAPTTEPLTESQD